MTDAGYYIFSALIREFWRFFSQWYIPGTNVTPAGMFLIILFITVNLRVIRRITFSNTSDTKGSDNKQ